MSLIGKSLPRVEIAEARADVRWEAPADLLEHWARAPVMPKAADDRTFDIFEPIGSWYDDVSVGQVSSWLKDAGPGDIRVRINSPGGVAFDGVAIYNLLAAHEGKVDVDVIGIAASAASIIAMAGDTIRMGAGSMMMIHNAWAVALGNKTDMRGVADILEKIDASMVEIYAARTGNKAAEIVDLMDAETYMGAQEAVDLGFADATFQQPEDENALAEHSEASAIKARRQIEVALAKSGVPRKDRAELIARAVETVAPRDAGGTHDAERDAGVFTAEQLAELKAALKLNL